MEKEYKDFVKSIDIPSKRVLTGDLLRLAWGTDAGFYRMTPRVVVITQNEDEVRNVLAEAGRRKLPVVFRAAGTSLSGQSITDSILVVAGKGWEDFTVLEDGKAVRLQPGIIGARVNEILKPFGRIFTPDPASKASAMVGGIVTNNASGMNCGVHANSDRMLRSARIVLADGTVIDTALPEGELLRNDRIRKLHDDIAALRDEVRADKDLVERIKKKYSIKNVTGLNLRPFIAYNDPIEIIAHLMVGSEGTLGFLSEVVMSTGPLMPRSASAMAYFSNMKDACRAVVHLKGNNPEVYSCELLDKKSLASVNDTTGTGLTALLIETKAGNEEDLRKNIASIEGALAPYNTFKPVKFTTDPAEIAALWKMRSGIFPAVGGTRPVGTTSLIEDIAFPIEHLPEATAELAHLIEDCGYEDSCIYGHALDGNYHFVIAQSFDSKAEVDKYSHLIDEIVKLVVDRYDGSLKAEHGTGRNMAPFVKKEWGEKAYSVMKRVKDAFDPDGLLNPGVIFNDDPDCHLRNFKPLPIASPIIDKCIECGFCEVNCVSCGFTLSARERIVVRREIARLGATGEDPARLKTLEKEYKYLGEETCAADGLCSVSCPMGINTGDLTHYLREQHIKRGSLAWKVGEWTANHIAGVETMLRPLLMCASAAHTVLGDKATATLGKGLNKIGMPLWTPSLPTSFRYKPTQDETTARKTEKPKVVYFPSCINQTMGPSKQKGAEKLEPLVKVMKRLCEKAGYEVIFPERMEKLCCGMIWESKGMPETADRKTAQLEAALLKASENAKYPVLCDQSPCLHRMREHIKSMRLYEPAEFIADFLAPRLKFKPTDEPIAVHVTCSTRRMGLADKIIALAERCSTNVTVPAEVGCCGFAGDKGFTHPELNAWALRKLRASIEKAGARAGYSNSRTCEIGLTTNSGIPYQSIAYLVDKVTEA